MEYDVFAQVFSFRRVFFIVKNFNVGLNVKFVLSVVLFVGFKVSLERF
jgi:hypothetical protein